VTKDQNEERLAAIAFILDRVEQVGSTDSSRAFASELVNGLAECRHIEGARAGEFDDQNWRVQLIMMVRQSRSRMRPKLTTVR
jgi:hypothetical protein